MLHSAGNLGHEQLGCMSGPPLCWETRPELEGPQQHCPGSTLSLELGCLLARAFAGTSGRWPVAAADTHCGPLHVSAFDRGPSRKAEGSVTMEEAACLPREWEGPVHIVREAWLGAVGRGLRWEVGPRASWVTCGKPSPSLVLSMPFWTAGVELGRFSDFKASPESLLPTSLCDLE